MSHGRRRALAVGAPAATAATVGAVLAGLGSVVVSPLFPIGLAGEVEADRGMRVDGFVAVAGAVLLILVVVAVVGWRSWRRPAASAERTSPFASPGSGAGSASAPSPSSGPASPWSRDAVGGPSRSAPPWSASPSASSASSASAWSPTASETLVDEPARWGWTWSSSPDMDGPDRVGRGIGDDERLAGAAFLDQAYVDLGEAEVTGFALEPLRGEVGLAVRSGRAPAAPDEVALGHRTARGPRRGRG